MNFLNILILLLVPFSLSAQEISTVKVFDGLVAKCSSNRDLNNLGAYILKAKDASIIDGNYLNLKLNLSFFNCQKNRNQFKLVSASPYTTTRSLIHKKSIEKRVNLVSLQAYRDGVYELLLNRPIEDGNSSFNNIEFSTDLNDILNQEEAATLKEKGSVAISIDFSLVKEVETFVDGISYFNDRVAFGNFRVHLKIEESEKGHMVKLK
ncbi:MAG: hypothetical protein CME63_00160 [Halobacteriovoraceae bacterium]|nr:hypothetical protein [Halobacteriovoraceae bacterium]|tara:strand:- start:28535 stop:29158 length:624 start_codon:yes stop_codon:yes gene_type:complete